MKVPRKVEKPKKRIHQFHPGTKALMEIRCFQKSTSLLIPKKSFYQVVWEVLQNECSWMKIQALAVFPLHEVAEAYLVHLLEDGHICTIHAKCIMNQCVFSITRLFFVKRDKLLTGYPWLHQVLKKIFFQAILYIHEVYQKMFI